jgi:hypothetical protein
MSNLVRPEFPPPPQAPEDLIQEMRDFLARLSKMPELMVTWDLSDGQNLPGQQAAASTSQIMASLQNMILAVEEFMTNHPGKRVGSDDLPTEFWVMLLLASEGVARFDAGQSTDGKPAPKNSPEG